MSKIVQLKLVSGDELICKIHRRNFLTGNLKIKQALSFLKKTDPDTGVTFYAFIPFMSQVNHKDAIINLTKESIMAISIPNRLTQATYEKYVGNEHIAALNREEMADELIARMQRPKVEKSDAERELDKYEFDKNKMN